MDACTAMESAHAIAVGSPVYFDNRERPAQLVMTAATA